MNFEALTTEARYWMRQDLGGPIRPRESAVVLPRRKLGIREWSESNVILGPPSEETGPWRIRRTPYLQMIIDAAENKAIEEVNICASAQSGKTQGLLNVASYFMVEEAADVLYCMADKNTAAYTLTRRVVKMFEFSDDLSDHVAEGEGGNWELAMTNNASLTMTWSRSVAGLSSRPIRVVIFDEVDKPGYYAATREAGAVSLGSERTTSFFNKKIFLLSTPTIEEGNITVAMRSSDVVFDWHVPCPTCGQFQPLRWSLEYAGGFPEGIYRDEHGNKRKLGMVVWKNGRKATAEDIERAAYQCGSCGSHWSNIEKNIAVERGKGVPRSAGTGPIVGIHFNRLYSLLGRAGHLSELVRKWVQAMNSLSKSKLRGFINSALAEPWKNVVVRASSKNILAARADLTPQTIPEEAIALTAGIDVQLESFWFVVRAWAFDFTSWLIHYGQLATWEDVENLLFDTEYPKLNSEESMSSWRAGIDTGGGKGVGAMTKTEEVYWWLRNNGSGRGCRVWGTKGSSTPLQGKMKPGVQRDKTRSGKAIKGGLQLVMLDTAQLKDAFHFRLRQGSEKGSAPLAAYLHKETGNDYVRQVTAEEKRLDVKGVESWVQIRPDNHLLDCEVIAMSCADHEWIGGGLNILKREMDGTKRRRPGRRAQTKRPRRW